MWVFPGKALLQLTHGESELLLIGILFISGFICIKTDAWTYTDLFYFFLEEVDGSFDWGQVK